MKALETVNRKEAAPTYIRTKNVQDSVGQKHKTEPDFIGSGYHPPERFVPLLKKFSHPANVTHRAQLFAQLQRHYGNRYVQRVVAAYRAQNVEEDESTLASEITSRKGSGRALGPGNLAVWRMFKSGVIQAKLKIGQPNDIYEQEADRIAEQVMRMPEPQVPRQSEKEEEEEETLQAKPLADQITPQVQRQAEEEQEEEEILQTKESSGQTPEVTPDLESRILTLKGGGQPLPKSIRNYFEPRFGYDFSQVRAHTDSRAADVAQAIHAKAFTSGRHIVFGSGQYSPETPGGRRLLAHELTHVVHQSSGIKHVQRDIILHNAGCPLETLDDSRNSAQIGAMFGTAIAYGLTRFSTRTPGRKTVLGRMITPNQGEIWVSNATVFPVTEIRMYLTNQFANGSCEYNWTFEHEIGHWLGGCRIFERRLSLLQSDLEALPGPNTRQIVNGNQAAVEQARQNLEARVETILRCFRIEVCREISRFNRRLDLHDYPRAFSSCPQPRPQVPQVPPIATYLRTCNPPPAGCPRPIP